MLLDIQYDTISRRSTIYNDKAPLHYTYYVYIVIDDAVVALKMIHAYA